MIKRARRNSDCPPEKYVIWLLPRIQGTESIGSMSLPKYAIASMGITAERTKPVCFLSSLLIWHSRPMEVDLLRTNLNHNQLHQSSISLLSPQASQAPNFTLWTSFHTAPTAHLSLMFRPTFALPTTPAIFSSSFNTHLIPRPL